MAAYIRTHPGSAPTVKQHVAAIRMLGDWLVVSQVLPVNPAAAVRGPKHVVTKGATPVLSPAEARKLLKSIDTSTLAGLRDRALLSVMLYSFARVSAVLGMRRQDYFGQGSRGWLRLHEKVGKRHDVPAHHRAASALDAYVEAGRLEEPKAALFQTVDPARRRLTGRALDRRLVLAMIKRRAAAAGLPPSTCCHTFRATGITAYLSNGGDARARAADRGSRVSEDDEALRPNGGHGDGRRDRAHRDLSGVAAGRRCRCRSRPRDGRQVHRERQVTGARASRCSFVEACRGTRTILPATTTIERRRRPGRRGASDRSARRRADPAPASARPRWIASSTSGPSMFRKTSSMKSLCIGSCPLPQTTRW